MESKDSIKKRNYGNVMFIISYKKIFGLRKRESGVNEYFTLGSVEYELN